MDDFDSAKAPHATLSARLPYQDGAHQDPRDKEIHVLKCSVQDLLQSMHDMKTRLERIEAVFQVAPSTYTQIYEVAEGAAEVPSTSSHVLPFDTNSLFAQLKAHIAAEVLEHSHKLRKAASDSFSALVPAQPKSPLKFSFPESQAEGIPVERAYHFEESVWDLVLFIGHRRIGLCGSLLSGLQILIVLAVQIAFCIVCQLNFTDSDFDSSAQEGLQDFRLRYAHDVTFKDTASGTTLASAICADSHDAVFKMNRLMYGNAQVAVLEQIHSYLSQDASLLEKWFAGRTLCVLALFCWILIVFKHVRKIWHCFSAMMAVPTGDVTEICVKDDAYILTTIWRGRLCILFCTTILRIGCSGLLLFSGGAWLSYTADMKDLVLNAVALEFILVLDELVFSSLAPVVGKILIDQMEPVIERRRIFCKGLDSISLFALVMVPIPLLAFYFLMVEPLVSDMKRADDILCGGNLKSEYTRDTHMGMLWFRDLKDGTEDDAIREKNQPLVLAAVQTETRRSHQEQPEFGNYAGRPPFGTIDVSRVATMEIDVLVKELNPFCYDIDATVHGDTFKKLVEVRLGENFESCSDLKDFCMRHDIAKERSMFWLRTFCPLSCGCVSPKSIVPDHRSSFGCPQSCLTDDRYLMALGDQTMESGCNDTKITILNSSVFWPLWADHLTLQYMQDTNEEAHDFTLKELMLRDGCPFFQEWSKEDLKEICQGTSSQFLLRPLSPICPETCDCASGLVDGCAPACTPLFGECVPECMPLCVPACISHYAS